MRIEANRCDVCCCVRVSEVKPVRRDIVRTLFNKYFVPFVFRKSTRIMTILITIACVTIGFMSTYQIKRGLNQNVSLVSGSDIYDYFETLYTYGAAGPPAYVIFNNVNYTDSNNLEQMQEINAELSALTDTIQNPIYSWVSPFRSFIVNGVWGETCGSKAVGPLSFDE